MDTALPSPCFLTRFLAHVAQRPDAVALEELDAGRMTTYAALAERAALVRGALVAHAVQPGARVLVMLPNGPELVATFLACMAHGAVALPVSPTLRPRELSAIATRGRPALTITTAELAALHGETLRDLTGPVRTPDALCESARAIPLAPPGGNPHVLRLYTFKGVGRPLGVEHAYGALMRCVDVVHGRFAHQGPDSVHLGVLPMYPVFGLICTVMLPLSVGARVLILRNTRGVDLPTLLETRQVGLFCLVPDLARMLLEQVRAAQARDGGRRYALHPELMLVSGGSYLDPELATTLGSALGLPPVVQGYGTTEVLPVTVEDYYGPRATGTLGPAFDGVRLRVRTADGREARAGEAGELEVGGASVCAGFVDEPALTAELFVDGWFRTGDLVRLDLAGNLVFLGRRRRFTKVIANMVDLAEVEAVAEALDGVARASVAVRRDAQGRNGLAMHVALRDGATLDEAAIVRALREQLSAHKVPRTIRVVKEVA